MSNSLEQEVKPVDIDAVEEILAELQSIDYSKVTYDEIRPKVAQLVAVGFMAVTFPAVGIPIYRGRVCDVSGGEAIFTRVSEISYPHNKSSKPALNRASSNRYQVFYGTVSHGDGQESAAIAMTEVADLNPKNAWKSETPHIVMGSWIARKEITFAALGLHSEIAGNNQQARRMVDFETEACNALPVRGPLIQRVSDFMSKQFSKKVNGDRGKYLISAVYGDILFDHGINGIIFPSVQADGKALNIALRSDVVDLCLELDVAGVSRIQNIAGQTVGDWVLQCTRADGDKLRWVHSAEGYMSTTVRGTVEKMIKSGKWNNI